MAVLRLNTGPSSWVHKIGDSPSAPVCTITFSTPWSLQKSVRVISAVNPSRNFSTALVPPSTVPAHTRPLSLTRCHTLWPYFLHPSIHRLCTGHAPMVMCLGSSTYATESSGILDMSSDWNRTSVASIMATAVTVGLCVSSLLT